MSPTTYHQHKRHALGDAVEAWYEGQPENVKEWVDSMAGELQVAVAREAGNKKVMFGEQAARELLGALIIYCEKNEREKT